MTFKRKTKHFTFHLHVAPFLGALITASDGCHVHSTCWLRKTMEGCCCNIAFSAKESEVGATEIF